MANLRIQVRCNVCRRFLLNTLKQDTQGVELIVSPCDQCSDKACEKAYDTGYNDAYEHETGFEG